MKVIWEVDDGYVGKDRPQTLIIPDEDLADCETEEERYTLIDDLVQEEFDRKISWYIVRTYE
jgi:hypothetical protein